MVRERPAGAALIEAIKAKEIDTVIVYKRDRLGRDLNLGLAERLLEKQLKARVISVTDGKIVDDARLETTDRPAADVVRLRSEETSR